MTVAEGLKVATCGVAVLRVEHRLLIITKKSYRLSSSGLKQASAGRHDTEACCRP